MLLTTSNNVARSGDRNLMKKKAENILKYKDLTIEIQRIWNIQTEVIPVIIGVRENIYKTIRKYLERNIPGNHVIKQKLQNTAGEAMHTYCQKVLM